MGLVRYTRSFWAALFTFAGRGAIAYGDGRWEVTTNGATRSIAAQEIAAVSIRRGFFWSTLVLRASNTRHEFPGLSHAASEHLLGLSSVAAIPRSVSEALAAWAAILARRRYINHYAWSGWEARYRSVRELVRKADIRWLPSEDQGKVSVFVETFDQLGSIVARRNADHVAQELRECAPLFDTVESTPLNRQQRIAIVTDEDNTLVIAGAGTGKTSVVISKAAYVIRRLGVRPDEVLLLAYNNAAAAELKERAASRLGLDLPASTFHSLGSLILGQVEGAKPSLSRLARENGEVESFIDTTLRAMLHLSAWRDVLTRYLSEYLRPYRRREDFPDKNGYIVYLKGADIRSIKGEQVRSHEECTIADWLFLNGIEYEYEPPYEHDVSDPAHRQYRPDFRLVKSGVYIEHFGVDRRGNTAPWVNRDAYRQGMEWKRKTHARFSTRLVETYSYDRQEGALTERLAERLEAIGVRPEPPPPGKLEEAIERRGSFSILAKLLATFLQHFKEGLLSLEDLRRHSAQPDPQRARSFLGVFEHVHQAYEGELRAEGAIDFQDMIGRATAYVRAGRFRSPYRYVIVDEFQDTSRGRAQLVRALLDQVPDRRLTCVGDDWQSIYRFAGSDIGQMTRFGEHFGYSASVALDECFRFGRRLLKASAQFVQKNPAQLRKSLTSAREEGAPAVVVVGARPSERSEEERKKAESDDIRAVLARIASEHRGSEKASVFLLGRYRFSLPAPIGEIDRGFPSLSVEFRTAHGSKGLQADYVVILKATSGQYGFPSEITDDPLLSMVLAQPDAFEHAEERRLFYVALTRARRRVFILTRESQRSAFVSELLGSEYAGLVEIPEEWSESVRCQSCEGTLTRRVNSTTKKPFWGCVNYPYCDGSAEVCAVCQRGGLVLEDGFYRCSQRGCAARVEACPRCGSGTLTQRTNRAKGSKFWGCSRWKTDGCTFTRDLGASPAGSSWARSR